MKREQQITLDPHGNRGARGEERRDEADPRVKITGDRVARGGGVLGGTCLWRTVSDSISGAENCTVTRRGSAHWPVMSEGSKHVCSINSCIRSWLEIFPPVRLDDTDLYLDWFVKLSKFLGV